MAGFYLVPAELSHQPPARRPASMPSLLASRLSGGRTTSGAAPSSPNFPAQRCQSVRVLSSAAAASFTTPKANEHPKQKQKESVEAVDKAVQCDTPASSSSTTTTRKSLRGSRRCPDAKLDPFAPLASSSLPAAPPGVDVGCPICLDLCRSAAMLPCGHAYCGECLLSLHASTVRELGQAGRLQCAVCRTLAFGVAPCTAVRAAVRNIDPTMRDSGDHVDRKLLILNERLLAARKRKEGKGMMAAEGLGDVCCCALLAAAMTVGLLLAL